MERMATWQIALRRLEMPLPRFLLAFVLPAALAGLITAILLIWLTGGLSEGGLFAGFTGVFLIILLPMLTGGAAIYFPILEVQSFGNKNRKRDAYVHHKNGNTFPWRSRCRHNFRHTSPDERLWRISTRGQENRDSCRQMAHLITRGCKNCSPAITVSTLDRFP